MAQLLRQVALVSESSSVSLADLTQCSAAISKQASRDFAPIWDVNATVDPFDKLESVPLGYWVVMIVDADPRLPDSALGIHLDKDNQPFALVKAGNGWQITASHETLEMLADPFGNRLMAGDSPKPDQGRVEFLVEVCDPSEGPDYGYTVNGILLSDFYTPNYFDPVKANGVRYSYTGAITEPRLVLKGGYLSWHDPVTDHWWQEQYFDAQPQYVDLGTLNGQGSLRAQIDEKSNVHSLQTMSKGLGTVRSAMQAFSHQVAPATRSRAAAIHNYIDKLKSGGGSGGGGGGGGAATKFQRRVPPYHGGQG
jgi:hypothetical protein